MPDSLVGMRADAALAKLMGLSRTAAAELLEGNNVLLNGVVLGKSDKLSNDGLLEVSLPEPKNNFELKPVEV
ncbi:MAG: RNA pseudouridine synthase, partial [Micrococcales bacterium]